jgi:hypothetical protein
LAAPVERVQTDRSRFLVDNFACYAILRGLDPSNRLLAYNRVALLVFSFLGVRRDEESCFRFHSAWIHTC